jgi:hypothetical protein
MGIGRLEMRPSMILSLFLFVAFPLAAQRSPVGHAKSQYRFPPDHMACPVDLRVDRRAGLISREVDGKPIPTGQGLDLHFASTPERKVFSADITVHGTAGNVIAQPLTIASANPAITEDFHLSSSGSQPLTEKVIWTEKIRGITWIEVKRVVFSDGSTWQPTIPSECRVEPSLFVLVK